MLQPTFKKPSTVQSWETLHPSKQALVLQNWNDFDDPDAVVIQLARTETDSSSPAAVVSKPPQTMTKGHELFPTDAPVACVFDTLPQSKQVHNNILNPAFIESLTMVLLI